MQMGRWIYICWELEPLQLIQISCQLYTPSALPPEGEPVLTLR